jgi:hypothetical protein
VIETQEERSMELTFDLSKYKHSKTVHIEPKKGETAQEFFERFFPVARMEYEQRRQKHMKVALSLASQEFNDKKEET